MAGVPTEDQFKLAALASPPSPLDLRVQEVIIVGRGDESPTSSQKLQYQRGHVLKVKQQKKMIDIVFQASDGKPPCAYTFAAEELITIGYACPGASIRDESFCTENFHLKISNGTKTIEMPRSAWEHYRNLLLGGYSFDIMKDESDIETRELAKYLLNAPRPDSIEDTSSVQGYKSLSHYLMDRAANQNAADETNLVQYFKKFVVRHLHVIHNCLQGNQEPSCDLMWFGGSSAFETVSKSAFVNHAHILNATKEIVQKSIDLSSQGRAKSIEAANIYQEAGGQYMGFTVLPLSDKVEVVTTRGFRQQLGFMSEVSVVHGASNVDTLPSLLDRLKSACTNQFSSHPTSLPPPPPPGTPPPCNSDHMPLDQWLRASTQVDGVWYAYWYNPAVLDYQGCPIRSWTCPVLIHESATTSAIQNHGSSCGGILEPSLRNVTVAVTEVPGPNFCNAGKTLQLGSTVLQTVFYAVYPGQEKSTQKVRPGLEHIIGHASGGSQYRLTVRQAHVFDIPNQLSHQNSFSVVISSSSQHFLSMLAELFSCGKTDAQAQLEKASASKCSFYEALARENSNTESITCFVYDSGAYGLSSSRGQRSTSAQSLSTAISLRKPRDSIFGTYFLRGGMTDVEYIKKVASSAAPTTLRLVLSGKAVSSALFFPPWSKYTQPQEGVFQDLKATACWMAAGSVVDPSIIFSLNRTFSVLSGKCVFMSWDLDSAAHSDGNNMLPEDIFSNNQPFKDMLCQGIIRPSILNVCGGESALFRCGSIVSLVAMETSVLTYGDWGDVRDTLRYGEVVEHMQRGGLFDKHAQNSSRLFVERCLCNEMRASCIPSEFLLHEKTLQLSFSPGNYIDILCGFISSTTRTVSDELISQLFGVGKLSENDLWGIVHAGGAVPDDMLMVCTLTASCTGEDLDSGLKKEVVLNLCRVEVKSISIQVQDQLVFVLHWEKRAKRARMAA